MHCQVQKLIYKQKIKVTVFNYRVDSVIKDRWSKDWLFNYFNSRYVLHHIWDKVFKSGCLPQISLGPFLNTFFLNTSHFWLPITGGMSFTKRSRQRSKLFKHGSNNNKKSNQQQKTIIPANNYLFKVTDVVLVFLLLTLNIFHTFF